MSVYLQANTECFCRVVMGNKVIMFFLAVVVVAGSRGGVEISFSCFHLSFQPGPCHQPMPLDLAPYHSILSSTSITLHTSRLVYDYLPSCARIIFALRKRRVFEAIKSGSVRNLEECKVILVNGHTHQFGHTLHPPSFCF